MVHLLAFSLQDQVEEYGAYIGIGAFFGLAILTLLYFAQAREVRRMREWAGRAPERLRELEERVITETEAMQRFRTESARRPRPLSPATPAAARSGATGDGATRSVPIPAPPVVPARPQKPGPRPVPIRPGGPIPKVAAAVEQDGKAAADGVVPAKEPTGGEGPPPSTPVPGAPATGEPATDEAAPSEAVPASASGDAAEMPAEAEQDTPAPDQADSPQPEPVEASAAGLGQLGAPAAGEASQSAAAGAVAASAAARQAPAGRRGRTARAGGRDLPPSNGAPRPGEIPRATAAAQRSQRQPAAAPLRTSFPSTTMPPKRSAAGGGGRGAQGRRSEQPERSRRPVLIAIAAVVGLAIVIFGATRLFGGGGDDAPPPNRTNQTNEPTATSTSEPARKKKKTTQSAARGSTTVAVLNGTTFTGLAATTAAEIAQAGFKRGSTGNDADQARSASVVTYKSGFERQARDVAGVLKISDVQAASADTLAIAGGSAQVVVIVGADQRQP